MNDKTFRSVGSSLPAHAEVATPRCAAAGTMYPTKRLSRAVRQGDVCKRHADRGLGSGGTTNASELPLNIVRMRQAKGAERLEPKGMQRDILFQHGNARTGSCR